MNYISYSEICKILGVDRNNPSYNPKKFETIQKHIDKINSIIDDGEKAEEIVNFAQIGEFGMIALMYP